MLLQVHDELLFDVPQSEEVTLLPLVRDKMVHAIPLEIPIVVEIGTGKNWLEAH
jgi:DNA polymerase-1